MGFAAIRGTAIDAVCYFGEEDYGDVYPYWFVEYASNFSVEPDGESLFCYPGDWRYAEVQKLSFTPHEIREEDDYHPNWNITVADTFVLRNPQGLIYHLAYDEFLKSFHGIGVWRAALKEDCVKFFCFDGQYLGDATPMWIRRLIESRILILGDLLENSLLVTDDGPIQVTEGSFLVQGRLGDVRYYEANEFFKYYELGM